MKLYRLIIGITAIVGFLCNHSVRDVHAVSYSASAIPFVFEDISATGGVISGLADADDSTQIIPLGGFAFNFYGNSFVTIGVSSNGLLTFGGTDASFTNTDLTTSPTLASIAVFWDDLITSNCSPGCDVRVQTLGAPGSRRTIIQWDDVAFFSGGTGGDTLTFQAILFEGSNNIQFNYLDLVSGNASGNNGASATVGIKNAGVQGPDRLLLAFNNGPNAFVGTGQSTLITSASVPEPTSLLLLGAGAVALVCRRRRR